LFYFLQPVWMFAMTGIIIPVIIHLWNVQQGKILKVGSVSLLTQANVRNTSSIKLHDLLLLLLRCLLIILLALLLAQPQWQSPGKASQKGWILMEKNNLQQTYARFKPQVDSLVSAGYTFHYFNNGFEEKNIQDALTEEEDTTENKAPSYWSLLSQLNNKLDTSLSIYLFTSNTLNRFTGNRPAVALNLHWHTYTPTASSAYLAGAYGIAGDSLYIITANSTQTGTTNTYTNVAVSQLKNEGYTLNTGSNGLQLSYKNGTSIIIDTSTLHIIIYTDKYATDAGYVKAAIDAVQQFSRHKIITTVENNISRIPANVSWLFWLSDQAIPSNIAAKNIFIYANGTAKNIQSWLMEEAGNTSGQPALYKSIPSNTNVGQAIWQDGFGSDVLQLEEATSNTYRFYSRFNPSWNDLPWSNSFPQMMFNLLLHTNETLQVAQANDNRMMDEKQLQPYFVKAKNNVQKTAGISTDLSPSFWLAAFAVFLAERIISSRVKKHRSNAR
jgi:hypothetical protein